MAKLLQPTFKIITGGKGKPSPWLCPPLTVVGKAPFDRSEILAYRVSSGDLQKHLSQGRRQPILDLWCHVHGELPPIAGVSRYNSLLAAHPTGLHTAHACFRGLMRPAGEDDRGLDFAAFVTKPKIGFRYQPSMNCLIQPFNIPDDLVFVIYARLDFPEGRAYQRTNGKRPVTNGVVTHWQLVECDLKNPMLPIDYETRFRRKLW